MRLRVLGVALAVALVASIPTLVSICELRCFEPQGPTEARSAEPGMETCSGHVPTATEEAPSAPSESGHDCGGHALLAKSRIVVYQVQLDQTFGHLALVTARFGHVDHEARHLAAVSVSTDLSPPYSRSPAVLRL